MSYCFLYNSPDDFANSNRLESRVFFQGYESAGASRESVRPDSTHNFFATFARAIHMSVEL